MQTIINIFIHSWLIFVWKVFFLNLGHGCLPLDALDNSTLNSEKYPIGSIAKFDCKPGYVHLHENNEIVTCVWKDRKAVWSGWVDCVPDYCQLPNMNDSNATLSHIVNAITHEVISTNESSPSNFSSNTILVYTCKEGFTYYEYDSFNLTCYMTQWNSSESSCRGNGLLTCSLLSSIIFSCVFQIFKLQYKFCKFTSNFKA